MAELAPSTNYEALAQESVMQSEPESNLVIIGARRDQDWQDNIEKPVAPSAGTTGPPTFIGDRTAQHQCEAG